MALTPHPARENNEETLNEDRRVLRRLEQHRRKTLTQAILPEWTQEDGLRLDLFGDPLTSSDSQEPRRHEPLRPAHIIRAVERQAECLRLAHAIIGHAAWIRAAYRRFLMEHLPRPDWDPD